MKDSRASLQPVVKIESAILTARGQKVILDNDLAAIYGVTTKAFNQAVKRNLQRFPSDFRFQLTPQEQAGLQALRSQEAILDAAPAVVVGNRSQFVTGSQKHRDPRYLPWAFTEHGALMAARRPSETKTEPAPAAEPPKERAVDVPRSEAPTTPKVEQARVETSGPQTNEFKASLDPVLNWAEPFDVTPEKLEASYKAEHFTKSPYFAWLKDQTRARFGRKPYSNITVDLTAFDGKIPIEESLITFTNGKACRISLTLPDT